MLAESIMGYDLNDPDTKLQAKPELVKIQADNPPLPPKLAFVKTPVWGQADVFTRTAFEELAEELGDSTAEVSLPQMFDQAHEQHRIIMEADIARSFAREYRDGADQLSDILKEIIERGQQVLAVDYNNAVDGKEILYSGFKDIFDWNDAIITPATIGVAPAGLESTGSPIFCTIWTLCGMPAITLPLMQGENGMPLGVQLVGPRGDDARLLRTARWLISELTG